MTSPVDGPLGGAVGPWEGMSREVDFPNDLPSGGTALDFLQCRVIKKYAPKAHSRATANLQECIIYAKYDPPLVNCQTFCGF